MSPIRDPFAERAECPMSNKKIILSGEQLILEGRVLGLSGRIKCSNQASCGFSDNEPVLGSGCLIQRISHK